MKSLTQRTLMLTLTVFITQSSVSVAASKEDDFAIIKPSVSQNIYQIDGKTNQVTEFKIKTQLLGEDAIGLRSELMLGSDFANKGIMKTGKFVLDVEPIRGFGIEPLAYQASPLYSQLDWVFNPYVKIRSNEDKTQLKLKANLLSSVKDNTRSKTQEAIAKDSEYNRTLNRDQPSDGGFATGLDVKLSHQIGPCELLASAKAALLFVTPGESLVYKSGTNSLSANAQTETLEKVSGNTKIEQIKMSQMQNNGIEVRKKDGISETSTTIVPRETLTEPGTVIGASAGLDCQFDNVLGQKVSVNASGYAEKINYNVAKTLRFGTPAGSESVDKAVVGAKVGVGMAF